MDVNEELKFLGKFKKKKIWGGGSGGGGGVKISPNTSLIIPFQLTQVSSFYL